MASETVTREAPASHEEAALLLRRCSDEGLRVCPVGGGTKVDWGGLGEPVDVELSSGGMRELVEHNEGDLTAVLDAGAPLGAAQARFAEAGQMLALDPSLGAGDAATIGGVVASGDSGPLRHRYGAARDLVVGMTMALADGTIARAGGKVIKNVAGYDLAKLLAGSFGTLGLILQVAVRLHPLASTRVTLRVEAASAAELAAVASSLSHAHLEMESLDVNWSDGAGAVLARFGGAAAHQQATAAAEVAGGGEVVEDDATLWERQRGLQRSRTGVVVRVSGLQAEHARVVEEAERAGATLVGRAALGISWLALEQRDDDAAATAVGDLRSRLAPRPCVVLDAPAAVREALDVWDERDEGRLALTRRVKERFDPGRTLRPGVFVGGS
jgi:glycolate oxidase FAD binding subunit